MGALGTSPTGRRYRHAAALLALTLMATPLARRADAAPLAGGSPSAGGTPFVEPSRRADVVVVSYREVLGEIGDADRGPLLQIYGDGRMVTHYPAYMKRAGDYEQRLTRAELDRLMGSLAGKGLLDLDVARARADARAATASAHQRARAAKAPVTVFEAADAATTVIELSVDRYRPATAGAREVRNVSKRIAWTGLRTDAEQHPDVSAIRDLAAAEQELRALRERPGFTRVR